MIHICEESYKAILDNELLGYIGETNARTIEFEQPVVEGADSYRLRLRYSDNAVYDVPIVDNKILITASLLREVGEIECQWIATKSNGDTYDLVAKSQVFGLIIEPSISDDIMPIPSYEQAKAISDKVLSAVEDMQVAIDKINSIDLDNLGYDDSEIQERIRNLRRDVEDIDEQLTESLNGKANQTDFESLEKEVGDNYRGLSTDIGKLRTDLNGNVNSLGQRINTKADKSDVDELSELIGTLNTQLENRLGGVVNE